MYDDRISGFRKVNNNNVYLVLNYTEKHIYVVSSINGSAESFSNFDAFINDI